METRCQIAIGSFWKKFTIILPLALPACGEARMKHIDAPPEPPSHDALDSVGEAVEPADAGDDELGSTTTQVPTEIAAADDAPDEPMPSGSETTADRSENPIGDVPAPTAADAPVDNGATPDQGVIEDTTGTDTSIDSNIDIGPTDSGIGTSLWVDVDTSSSDDIDTSSAADIDTSSAADMDTSSAADVDTSSAADVDTSSAADMDTSSAADVGTMTDTDTDSGTDTDTDTGTDVGSTSTATSSTGTSAGSGDVTNDSVESAQCADAVQADVAQVIRVDVVSDLDRVQEGGIVLLRFTGQTRLVLTSANLQSLHGLCIWNGGGASIDLVTDLAIGSLFYYGRGSAQSQLTFSNVGPTFDAQLNIAGAHALLLKGPDPICMSVPIQLRGAATVLCEAQP